MTLTSLCQYLVLIIGLLISMTLTIYADPPLPTPIGRVIWVKGTLKAAMPSGEIRNLQKMSVIYLQDTLSTDEQSRAEVAFTDNTLLTLGPSTKYQISQYRYHPNEKKSISKYIVNFIQGSFRTITGVIAKQSGSAYEVETPVGTIGVRGTEYATYYKNNEMYIKVYKGVVCATPKNKQNAKSAPVCSNDTKRVLHVKDGTVELLDTLPAGVGEELEIDYATISAFDTQSKDSSSNNFCITY